MATFADLGIPFPLFEAPIETCPDYVGRQHCCVSGQNQEHCFRLGVGAWVKLGCPGCGGDLFLSPTADFFRATTCRHCGAPTPPPLAGQDEAFVCYRVLRDGLAGYTKDSDFGLISWEQMESGWTHGIPGGRFPGFDTRTTSEGWVQVQLPKEILSELTRTPNFVTWQGDRWLFQGSDPMVYIGEWKKRDFESHAPNGMRAEEFFKQVIRDYDPRLWPHVDNVCIYVFRGSRTGAYAAFHDMD